MNVRCTESPVSGVRRGDQGSRTVVRGSDGTQRVRGEHGRGLERDPFDLFQGWYPRRTRPSRLHTLRYSPPGYLEFLPLRSQTEEDPLAYPSVLGRKRRKHVPTTIIFTQTVSLRNSQRTSAPWTPWFECLRLRPVLRSRTGWTGPTRDRTPTLWHPRVPS